MKNSLSIIILLGVLIVSCGNKKSTTQVSESKKEEIEKKETSITNQKKLLYFTVSFFSPGDGIDYKIKTEYDTLLVQKYPALKIKKQKWGREGEVNYCIETTGMSPEQKSEFIAQSKAILSKSIKVRFKENNLCEN